MGQVLHGSATTTEAVRRAIQNSQESIRTLAKRHSINPKTVAKCVASNTWIEFNVTAAIAGNGTYSFVLATDSTDGITFSSREGGHPPQLVLKL